VAAKAGMKRAPKRAWTALEKRYVVANYGRIPTCDMAEKLGRDPHCVRAAARRWGVRTNYVILPRQQTLLKMWREGLSDTMMAACIGCTRGAINKWRRRNDLPPNSERKRKVTA
jgi:hypothetical protein